MMRIATLVALATAGAAASGGIALAAASAPSEPGRTLPAVAASQAQAHAAPVLDQHPAGKPDTAGKDSHAPHGTPNPNLNGLCHAWLAGAGAEHGNARSNPAFSVLVATAGGSDAVDGFCTERLGSVKHGDDSDEPEPGDSDAANPDHPNQSSHPGNTSHPNRTSHPSGRPEATPPVTPPTQP
jgi:hypothetical protein